MRVTPLRFRASDTLPGIFVTSNTLKLLVGEPVRRGIRRDSWDGNGSISKRSRIASPHRLLDWQTGYHTCQERRLEIHLWDRDLHIHEPKDNRSS